MQISLIGCGNMGQAIVKALSASNKIYISDRDESKVKAFGFAKNDGSFSRLTQSDFVIIAVKPQDMADLAGQIRGKISKRSILISIAAGVTIKKLSKLFNHQKVVRVMPNLGLSVGHGVAVYKTVGLTDAEKSTVAKLLSEFTENFEVKNEKLIDAVTAISGSGPAYFFFLADNLIKAAVQIGLSRTQARLLVEKTLAASAVLQKDHEYAELLKKIASKKGTTEAALKIFNQKRTPEIIKSAVRAAFLRAGELSRG